MSGPDYFAIQVIIYSLVGFVIGYGCKAYICDDNSESQIEALEEEFDRMEANNNEEVERRSQELIDRITNSSCQQVVAYPVQPTAPEFTDTENNSNNI